MLQKTENRKPKTVLITALIFLWLVPGLAATTDPWAEADGLLKAPDLDFGRALRALDLYEKILAKADPPRAPLLTRLARNCFLLGELTVPSQRQKYYEKGQTYAEMILAEQPSRVEGHYWLAMHLCGLAEVCGSMQGRRLLPRIIKELERVLALDETYDQAGGHRVLGRIYYEAPGWPFSVGDFQKSLQHLTRAVRLAPDNSTNHLYLAETLIRLNQQAPALQELEQALKAPRHALLPQGLEEDRREARRLLDRALAGDHGDNGGPAPGPSQPPEGSSR